MVDAPPWYDVKVRDIGEYIGCEFEVWVQQRRAAADLQCPKCGEALNVLQLGRDALEE